MPKILTKKEIQETREAFKDRTASQAAKILGITKETAYQRARRLKISFKHDSIFNRTNIQDFLVDYNANMPMLELRLKYGLNTADVSRIRSQYNIPKRPMKFTQAEELQICAEYNAPLELSTNELAKKWKTSASNIFRIMAIHGFKRRNMSESQQIRQRHLHRGRFARAGRARVSL